MVKLKKQHRATATTVILLLLASVPAAYVFNYFSGALFQDPVDVTVDTLDKLNYPPIIIVPTGDLPFNETFTTNTVDGLTCYQYWYEWLPNPSHPANDWEMVYLIWNTNNPILPTLVAVITRIHFISKLITSGFSLKGTQLIVAFSTTFHTPVIRYYSGPTSLLVPSNSTTLYPIPPANSTQTNTYISIYDPNSPYSTGPNAYEQSSSGNAAPIDCFGFYSGPRSIQNGFLYGIGAFAGAYFILAMGGSRISKRRPFK